MRPRSLVAAAVLGSDRVVCDIACACVPGRRVAEKLRVFAGLCRRAEGVGAALLDSGVVRVASSVHSEGLHRCIHWERRDAQLGDRCVGLNAHRVDFVRRACCRRRGVRAHAAAWCRYFVLIDSIAHTTAVGIMYLVPSYVFLITAFFLFWRKETRDLYHLDSSMFTKVHCPHGAMPDTTLSSL